MGTDIPAAARILLDFIYYTETGRPRPDCYRVIFGHREAQLPQPITEMTLDELTRAQREWGRRWGSSAAGAGQFLRATVLNLMAAAGVSGSSRFGPGLQDRFAFRLLEGRGYSAFVSGQMSRTAFGLALAQEWASLPVLAPTQGAHRKLRRGQSYYTGDKLNAALVSPDAIERLLDRVLEVARGAGSPADAHEQPEAPDPAPAGETAPAGPAGPNEPQSKAEAAKELSTSKRFWTWLTTGGGTTLLPFVDWRVQIIIAVAVVAFAAYAIATMPAARRLLGLPAREA